jgi:hypothetical protein
MLKIPIIDGSVTGPNKVWPINLGVYQLLMSGIALASVNGTEGASRSPKSSHEPFVFDSPDTTGTVTLDLDTSASKEWLKVELEGPGGGSGGIPLIDTQLGNLEKKILTFFETSPHSIHWDLAQVNNSRPEHSGSTQLVPESFRFAAYAPSEGEDYTILSLFIHLDGRTHYGAEDQLQGNWTSQWSHLHYGVPPIPQPYTASLIFSNKLFMDLIRAAAKSSDLTMNETSDTSSNSWPLKFNILTHKKFEMEPKLGPLPSSGFPPIPGSWSIGMVSVDLDTKSTKGLTMTIGKNVHSVLHVICVHVY